MKHLLTVTLIFLTLISSAQALSRRTFLHPFGQKNGQVKVAFFDADSTLRVSISGSVSANGPRDVMLLPNVADKIAKLNEQGYLIMVVSNQGGVSQGHVKIEIADSALKYMSDLILEQNPEAKIHYIDFAEGEGEFRKPGVGMAMALEQVLESKGLNVDWKNSFMVGDSAYKKGKDTRPDGKLGTHFSNSDRLFAENLRIPFYEPTDFFGWRQHGIDVFDKASQVLEYIQAHGN